MRAASFVGIGASVAALFLSAFASGCARHAAPSAAAADGSGVVEITVRVPGALEVARAIDTLSVAIDPASLAETQVTTHAGAILGVETDAFVFAQGEDRPVLERRGVGRGADFAVAAAACTWTTKRDGVPAPDTKYVVEVQLVLFETDMAPAKDWDPHAGSFKPLWRGTLRQAEE